MNAVLHDCANAVANESFDWASPSKFVNLRPPTSNDAGHDVAVSLDAPAPRSAADVTILNVDPGGY